MLADSRAAGANVEDAAARFRVFAVLYALATLLYHRWQWFPVAVDGLPMVAAALVIARPSSARRFLALVLLQGVLAYRDLPEANTNRTLMVFVASGILCAGPIAWWKEKRLPASTSWFLSFEPMLRAQLLVVYAWACWHKLNTDWFDIHKSCGVDLYLRVAAKFPFIPWPTGPAALTGVVYGTVVIEGLLPLLLFSRRTRLLGISLGLGLHFAFGLTLFYDFSMAMLSLLFLFAPPEFARRLVETPLLSLRSRLRLSPKQWSWALHLSALAFILVTRAVFWDMYDFFALAWWGLLAVYAVVAWIALRERWTWPGAGRLLSMHPVLAVFPLAVFLNGLCPYIGSKTETSFAMYSNLRTEGGRTNHLIVPRPLALFDYQTDLVSIESSSDSQLSGLAAKGYPVPFYSLRKRVAELRASGLRNIEVVYLRAGSRVVTTQAEAEPAFARPPSYFQRKFLRFREILPMDANVCSH